MKIPNWVPANTDARVSLARIVSEDSQHCTEGSLLESKSSKDS